MSQNKAQKKSVRSLSNKILFRILILSAAVTFIITSIQLIFDYKQGQRQIKNAVEIALETNHDTIANSSWSFDATTVRLIFEGMIRTPDILYVSYPQLNIQVGDFSRPSARTISKEVVYRGTDGQSRPLGTITVGVTYKHLMYALTTKIFVILLTQAMKTFVVSFFILLMIQRLVIRPLRDLGYFVLGISPESEYVDFQIPPQNLNDEVGLIASHVNVTKDKIKRYYDELKGINLNLESIVKARTDEIREKTVALERSHAERKRMIELGQVISGISHEIKNPLTIIENLVMFLEEGEQGNTASLRKGIDLLKKNSARLTSIVSSMNMLQHGYSIQLNRVDIAELMDSLCNEFTEKLESLNITLNRNWKRGLFIQASTSELKEAIRHLINNSIDAIVARKGVMMTPYSGEITLHIEEVNGTVVLKVQDNGNGMSPETLGRAITPFFTTKRPNEHRGLGLSVSANILAVHHSTLTIHSKPAEQTVVTVIIPKDSQPAGGPSL